MLETSERSKRRSKSLEEATFSEQCAKKSVRDDDVRPFTPVAGPIFETKNRAIFLERFFGRGITAREQLSQAVILARF